MPASASNPVLFASREDAADQLANQLAERLSGRVVGGDNESRLLVLGIPRAGIVMGRRIADRLNADLEPVLVHRFATARHPEVDLGIVTEDGEVYLSRGSHHLGFTEREVEEAALDAIERLQQTRKIYFGDREATDPTGRTVIVVDDGMAGNAPVIAAIRFLRSRNARSIFIATPIATERSMKAIEQEGAEAIVLSRPEIVETVGRFYRNFGQVTDQQVMKSLAGQTETSVRLPGERDVEIEIGRVLMQGVLAMPQNAEGLVICAHGTGEGRFEWRNQAAARLFLANGLGVLLIDLLDDEEAQDARNFLDAPLLGHRLGLVTEWISRNPQLNKNCLGYYGAGVAGAAALQNAAEYPVKARAVVVRSARTDLASSYLDYVRAPTLLMSDEGDDEEMLNRQRTALETLRCEKKFVLSPISTDGETDPAAEHAAQWFKRNLNRASPPEEIQRQPVNSQ